MRYQTTFGEIEVTAIIFFNHLLQNLVFLHNRRYASAFINTPGVTPGEIDSVKIILEVSSESSDGLEGR